MQRDIYCKECCPLCKVWYVRYVLQWFLRPAGTTRTSSTVGWAYPACWTEASPWTCVVEAWSGAVVCPATSYRSTTTPTWAPSRTPVSHFTSIIGKDQMKINEMCRIYMSKVDANSMPIFLRYLAVTDWSLRFLAPLVSRGVTRYHFLFLTLGNQHWK